jgi:hypothetical protein
MKNIWLFNLRAIDLFPAHSDVNVVPMVLMAPPSRSPSPELLDSDDEDEETAATTSNVPSTLRNLPAYFPDLPPKHTYLQTPVGLFLLTIANNLSHPASICVSP